MMNTIHKQNTEKKKLSLCIQIYILNSKFSRFIFLKIYFQEYYLDSKCSYRMLLVVWIPC